MRAPRGAIEGGRDVPVRALRRAREMPRALLRLRDELCEPPVQGPSLPGSRRAVDTGREQGVGEADPLALELDDLRLERGPERFLRVVPSHRLRHERDRRV